MPFFDCIFLSNINLDAAIMLDKSAALGRA